MRGKLPTEFRYFSDLQVFRVPGNDIVDVAAGFSEEMISLTVLDMSGNPIVNADPILERLTNLATLVLDQCQLQGTISSDVSKLTNLLSLSLEKNLLTGTLTNEFQAIASLRDLALSENEIHGNLMDLIRGQEDSLRLLQLAHNRIGGSLTPEIGKFSNLQVFDATLKDLTGSIVSEMGEATKLTALLSFKDNSWMDGALPRELGNLSLLKWFDVSGTSMSGTIPSDFGGMSSLESLIMGNSLVSGTISSDICALPNLQRIQPGIGMDCAECEVCYIGT